MPLSRARRQGALYVGLKEMPDGDLLAARMERRSSTTPPPDGYDDLTGTTT
ncbi:hypothetical protein JIX56_22795 [Streptomyces sp. CA-210063]|uniref:hypothetical protein n=1 Tax=Streptomyces sp. CA-210063 TaxID=2801029 RepID=UPI00214B8A50|nr:hypothetical protein [Streptomyces sp. CA-210063]UUU32500.1 hypothetical protein JIX56_22795 [Streptomyces sp. CA-210063]